MSNARELLDLPAHPPAQTAAFAPFLIRGLLSEKLLERARAALRPLKGLPLPRRRLLARDFEIYSRRTAYNHPFFVTLHREITGCAETLLRRKLKRSYVLSAMYLKGQGRCPRHTDRPQCKYTVDACIDQAVVWPIFVAPGEAEAELRFDLHPGDAVLLSGTDHPHRRDPIQPDNFCDLAFFHFVDPGFARSLG